jgi:signal peptidase
MSHNAASDIGYPWKKTIKTKMCNGGVGTDIQKKKNLHEFLSMYSTFPYSFYSYIPARHEIMCKMNDGDEKAKMSSAFPRKYLVAFIIFAVVAVGAAAIRYATNTFDPFFVVASDSMVPTLQVGDLIIMKHVSNNAADSSFNDVKMGDVILFKNPNEVDDETGQPITIVHRVVEINDTATGDRIIKTKGDNNPESIADLDYPIYKNCYIGKVLYVIPAVGTLELSPYRNYVLAGMGVAMIATLIVIFRIGRS